MGTGVIRTVAGIAALSVLAAATVLARSAQGTAAGPQDPVVVELRALREGLNQRLEATMRMQLLVARLQLQEQRTSSVLTQLRDVETRLRENDAARQQAAGMLKAIGIETVTEAEKVDNPFLAMFAGSQEKFDAAEADLRQQQAELTRQLSDEQARWRAYNAQLDQLEQLFPLQK